jgi:hypothetical protein
MLAPPDESTSNQPPVDPTAGADNVVAP